jgi:membrane fusion protein, multidrug efflux system
MKAATRWMLAVAVAAALGAIGYVAVAEGHDEARSARTAGRPAIAVDVATVVTGDLSEAIDVVGSLAPKFSADVKSEVSGVVRDVYVSEWVPVRKGARMARLETNEVEAGIDAVRATGVQARVAEARARREYDRAMELRQYGLITSQQVDEARSALEAAEAASAAAGAQVRAAGARLQKYVLSAPIDGVVALRNVNVGDRAENMGGGEPLFRIVDNRILNLTVSVPTTRLADLRVGQPLEFTTDADPERVFGGRVMFINPAVDETSRSVKVVAEVPNADGVLKGGLFAKGRIILATKRDVVQVPAQALQKWNMAGRTAEVFVVRSGQAERRAVRTGACNGTSVEIGSGVLPGEQVVTRGAFAVRGGEVVKVIRTGKGA